MTSYEIVRNTILFERPDRIPMAMRAASDIAEIGCKPVRGFQPQCEGMNEWGDRLALAQLEPGRSGAGVGASAGELE